VLGRRGVQVHQVEEIGGSREWGPGTGVRGSSRLGSRGQREAGSSRLGIQQPARGKRHGRESCAGAGGSSAMVDRAWWGEVHGARAFSEGD
jgi:hypothetical protein